MLSLRKGYTIQERLGRGSFGEVYTCTNQKGEALAAKLEERRSREGKRRSGPSQLRYEQRVYKLLEGGSAVPRVYDFFTDGDYNVLVMDRLGKSIEDILQEQGGSLSTEVTLAIGIKLISALKHIHDRGIVHRDLKPQNMMLSKDTDSTQIFVIDFGLSKRFEDPVTGHIPYQTNKRGLTGTPRYTSVSSHMGAEQSRRDDLESLVYILCYLRSGSLPWQGIRGKTKQDKYDAIKQRKQNISDRRLATNFPPSFVKFVKVIRNLKFKERPPYSRLTRLLLQAAEENVHK